MRNHKKHFWAPIVITGITFMFTGCAPYDPPEVQDEPITCSSATPILKPGQKIGIMCWNVQYMAGKNYVFFCDLLEGNGPDTRPSSQDIQTTIDEVARTIRKHNPDIILLQEVDDGSKRTDRQDQLQLLLAKISQEYVCHSSAFYHKAPFVPHPKIWGSVGVKLSTVSKYKIAHATRHQLALKDDFWLRRKFDLKRAVLETRLPIENGKDFVVMNTHLSAFAQGDDTMQKQVKEVKALLDRYVGSGHSCILGGDFNLLLPGISYAGLPEQFKAYYQEESELQVLANVYSCVPSVEDVNGPQRENWFTHYPNNPAATGPDRTIDFVFYSPDLVIRQGIVDQDSTLHISDHMPIVVDFIVP